MRKIRQGFIQHHSNGAGFTLIELLVVSIILLTLTGAVLVNYNNYNGKQKARQALLTLKNNFRSAQSRAYNGEKPAGCTPLDGYIVSFTETSYTTQAQCGGLPLVDTAQTVTLATGLTFIPVPSSMLFRVLSHGLDNDVTITITIAELSKSYQVTVSKSGDISDISEVTQTP